MLSNVAKARRDVDALLAVVDISYDPQGALNRIFPHGVTQPKESEKPVPVALCLNKVSASFVALRFRRPHKCCIERVRKTLHGPVLTRELQEGCPA